MSEPPPSPDFDTNREKFQHRQLSKPISLGDLLRTDLQLNTFHGRNQLIGVFIGFGPGARTGCCLLGGFVSGSAAFIHGKSGRGKKRRVALIVPQRLR